jgi:uncharacterized membrane protein YfcA
MGLLHSVLAVLSGGLVGFTLGVIGGGGSIMATPLLLYIVGLQPHEAIGTGALAVSVNAFANFASFARAGNVRWDSAVLFAVVGVVGAAIGSTIGKAFDGQRLLFLFAILMIVVGVLMLRRGRRAVREATADRPPVRRASSPLLVIAAALVVGVLSGFFGIGGGFLIVPGLLFSTGMPMLYAVGSSLLSVGSFGMTTAVNYALSGLINWLIAVEYIIGGIAGGLLGMRLAVNLAARKAMLNQVFAGFVFAVAAYMLYRNAAAFRAG